jgi:thiosulfate/3-mercaptopyruvate sulfurtransferase
VSPLIEVADLGDELVLDCRFRLQDPAAGRLAFEQGHIPGAYFLDLSTDLSGPLGAGGGRHPVPSRDTLRQTFSRLGITASTDVVVYDDADHAGAARAWMLLRWMGHDRVRVLNGGLRAWLAAGLELEEGAPGLRIRTDFPVASPLVEFVPKKKLEGKRLVDARAPERYRGEVEPMDAKAGHIPGAENLFYQKLLSADGKFLPKEQLELLLPREESVFYCGSGVTAAVLLLGAAVLGRKAAVYPGSWSEYSSDPAAAVETGAYRRGVVGVIRNSAGRVLLFERKDIQGSWQFPQGGIEGQETEEEALYREMMEEAGCEVKIVAKGKATSVYEWPRPNGRDANKGQRHTWFLCELVGEIVLGKSDGSFRGFEWVELAEAIERVVEFKRESYEVGLSALNLISVKP